MEKIDRLMIEMHDKINEHIEKTSGNTTSIAGEIFEDIKKICQFNGVPINYDKIEKIINDNADRNTNLMKDRVDFIIDCVVREIQEQELSKDPNKYDVINQKAYTNAENIEGKSTYEYTQKIIDELKGDLTEIKSHITTIAKEAGFKEDEIQYLDERVEQKITQLESEGGAGDLIFSLLRADKEQLIDETLDQYKDMEKELEEAVSENSKRNEFLDSLDVKNKDGFSLENQKEFSEETAKKLEEIQKDSNNQLRDDVII